jgi:hypothetical protein
MPAAIFLASSLVISFAAARRPGLRFEIDVGDCKIVGVADNVSDAAIFLDCPWRRKATFGHGPYRSAKIIGALCFPRSVVSPYP